MSKRTHKIVTVIVAVIVFFYFTFFAVVPPLLECGFDAAPRIGRYVCLESP